MKISVKNKYSLKPPKIQYIEDYFADQSNNREGVAECAQETADNALACLGRLVNLLVEQKIIQVEQIGNIKHWMHNDTIETITEIKE